MQKIFNSACLGLALLPGVLMATPLKCVQNGQTFYAQDRCPPDYQLAGEVARPALNPSAHETQQAQHRAQIEKQRLPKDTELATATSKPQKTSPEKSAAKEKEKAKKTKTQKVDDPKVFKVKAPKSVQ